MTLLLTSDDGSKTIMVINNLESYNLDNKLHLTVLAGEIKDAIKRILSVKEEKGKKRAKSKRSV